MQTRQRPPKPPTDTAGERHIGTYGRGCRVRLERHSEAAAFFQNCRSVRLPRVEERRLCLFLPANR